MLKKIRNLFQKNYYLLFGIMFIAAIILISNCRNTNPTNSEITKPNPQLQKVSLRLAWLPNVEFAGILVAQEKGYYKDAGIDLTIQPGGVGLDPVQLVASGSENIGIAEGSQLIMARSKGIPVKAVLAQFQKSPMCYITLADSGITTAEQFRGKKIGTQAAFTFVLETMLAHNNMSLKDVQVAPVGFDTRPLLEKQVDAFLSFQTNEPILLDLKGIKTNIIPASQNGYEYYTDTIFTTEEYARTNSELLRKFTQATIRGWQDALNNTDEAANLVVTKFAKDQDLEHQKRALKLIAGLVTADVGQDNIGKMNQDVWSKGIDNLLKSKQIEQKVDSSSIFTNDFLLVK